MSYDRAWSIDSYGIPHAYPLSSSLIAPCFPVVDPSLRVVSLLLQNVLLGGFVKKNHELPNSCSLIFLCCLISGFF